MVRERPKPRTYAGGQTLPALTSNYQSVQVGRNNDGELVPEQRAFVATVRNRSDSDMFVREGSGDGILIRPGESYVVTRIDGLSQISLKGANVGADYEIRSVEAHNSFSLVDRIEGFIQSVSALLQSSKRQTNIVGSEVTLDTNIAAANATLNTEIDAVNTTVGTSIDAATATVDTAIDSQNVTLDTDITAQSISDVSIDINKQSLGSVDDRTISINAIGSDNSSDTVTDSGTVSTTDGGTDTITLSSTISPATFVEILGGSSDQQDCTFDGGSDDFKVTVDVTVFVDSSIAVDLGQVASKGFSTSVTIDQIDDYGDSAGVMFLAESTETIEMIWTYTVDYNTTGSMSVDYDITCEQSYNGRQIENS